MQVSLLVFAARMTQWHGISDGRLTARIVGEFSAGKTRMLNELLGDATPQAFRPISSQEVQTRLPLEVTYGEQAALQVVDRRDDTVLDADVVATLEQFPHRQEIVAQGWLPERHRLRLSLPLQQLVLPEGDRLHPGTQPRRLFLIDMPGWNSGQDEIAEQDAETIMAGDHNLALVYVVQAARLDSAVNERRLKAFLKAVEEAEFVDDCHLLLVVTHCAEEDRVRLQARAAEQVRVIWAGLRGDADSLTLTVQCVDFGHMPQAQLQSFRQQFWQALLAPLGGGAPQGHPWLARIRGWPAEWALAPRVADAHAILLALRAVLLRAGDGGKFLPGMNMHRLVDISREEM